MDFLLWAFMDAFVHIFIGVALGVALHNLVPWGRRS